MSAILTAEARIDALLHARLSTGTDYQHRIAAPYRWDSPPEAVEVWAMDTADRWWLLVDGKRVARLGLEEEIVACRQAGLGPPLTPYTHGLTDPFDDDVAPAACSDRPFRGSPPGRGEEARVTVGHGQSSGVARILSLVDRMG